MCSSDLSETSLEGTYTFRFHARGTTSDGIPFTRTRTLSQFVRVKPAAETTHDAILLGDVVDGMQTAQMLFLPMDSIGNYLGPGFAASFNVDVDGGHLVGPLHELNNGIYLQEIRYPAAGPEPTVTVEMPETGFSMIVGADDEPQSEAMLGLLIWIQCIIILILLIWCWIRRRTSP